MDDKFIPLSVPNLKGHELEYVTKAVETEWVSTAGPYISEFENNISEYVNSKGAVSVQNGTSGLHTALRVCGVTHENEVIVPTLTFIASVNPVKYIGAEPIFMDCDETLNMDMIKLLDFCEQECIFNNDKLINKRTGKHIKAIIIVHVFGNMANMEKLMEIAGKYNLKVIEDAAEALGTYYTKGKYKNKFAGTIGDVGVYSFNGNKIITTGGGGMIVSDNLSLLEKAKYLTTQAKNDGLYYIHDEVGYNYRMTNIQAALGIAQLKQLEEFIKNKEKNYKLYKKEINEIKGLSLLDFDNKTRTNYWFYALYISEDYKLDRDSTIEYLSSNSIQARPIWSLIHEQKPYNDNQAYKIEKAKQYLNRIVNIPCSSNLLTEDVYRVIQTLENP